MFRTLRNQLIFSHILLLVVIIPVLGLTLVYTLENHFYVPNLERDLVDDAHYLVAITAKSPEVWTDPAQAQALIDNLKLSGSKHVMLIDADRRLLASNDLADTTSSLQTIQADGLEEALSGHLSVKTESNTRLQGEVVDVFAPVACDGQPACGVVRLTYRYASVADELLQLRYLIGGISIVSLIVGGALGLALALTVERPVHQVTRAIYDLARGERREALPEQGPEEIRMLLRAVNHLVERLRGLEQARRQLLANLVHELGRPLGALLIGIQAAQRGAKKDPHLLDDLLAGMDGEMTHLQRLLDDLAHLHDQVYGMLELDRRRLDLNAWLPDMLLPWQIAAQEKGLLWQTSIMPELPTLHADPDRLAQAVGNLLSNAIKYTPVGGIVSIWAGMEGSEICLQVRDTGLGIPAGEQQAIFKPFYRGEQGRRIREGMGLGLSIASDLVKAHGGRLTVESAAGKGSVFSVYLPVS